jgi:hypothetical protein
MGMNDLFGMEGSAKFAPEPHDSIRELRWKAESMLDYLRENEQVLRSFPGGVLDEMRALWQPLATLIARAQEDASLSDDARLEAHRVWAEEMHRSALYVVTMCVYALSDAAQDRFAEDPEHLDELIEKLERARPAAMNLLTLDDRNDLRRRGFLGPGE